MKVQCGFDPSQADISLGAVASALAEAASEVGRLCHGMGVHALRGRMRSCMLPAISTTRQLVVSDRSGAKVVPNVADPPRAIRTSRHAEGSSVCSVGCS